MYIRLSLELNKYVSFLYTCFCLIFVNAVLSTMQTSCIPIPNPAKVGFCDINEGSRQGVAHLTGDLDQFFTVYFVSFLMDSFLL